MPEPAAAPPRPLFSKIPRRLIFIAVCAAILAAISWRLISSGDKVLHIAVAGPMSGPHAEQTRAVIDGVRLYADRINETGGVNGRRLKIDAYDAGESPAAASRTARDIVEDRQTLAVIGHPSGKTAVAAGKMYKKQGVPVINCVAGDPDVTLENAWSFRTIFNAKLQARFIANYVKRVFKENSVSIISDDDPDYGAYLARVFEEAAEQIGLDVKYKWTFTTEDNSLEQTLRRIIYRLQTQRDAGIVFLATTAAHGAKLIEFTKDTLVPNRFIAADSFSTNAFIRQFEDLPKEKRKPGHYTNGVYAATHMLFDTTTEKGQRFLDLYRKAHDQAPDWISAAAWDAAMVLVEALRAAGATGDAASLKKDRQAIRDYLAGLTAPEDALEGVTGLIYFDDNGDAPKKVNIGVYKNQNLISAPLQFHPVTGLKDIPDIRKELKADRVLIFNGAYSYKTHVVYTGLEILDITELDLKKNACTMDFYIWFRYQGEIDASDIAFTNAEAPVDLGAPIREETDGAFSYKLYRVKGRFKTDFIPSLNRFRRHAIGVSFRHRALNRNNLIYVTDILGMGLTDQEALIHMIEENQALSPTSGWRVENAFLFQDVYKRRPLGRPSYVHLNKLSMDYSRFNAALIIKRNDISVRKSLFTALGALGRDALRYLIIINAVVLLLLASAEKAAFALRLPRLMWTLQVLFSASFLFLGEILLIMSLEGKLPPAAMELVPMLFDILWWIAAAVLLTIALERFVWEPVEKKAGRNLPNLIRRMTAFVIYLLAFFGIVAYVFDQKLTGLLATSGVAAMIIGLAIQINISNIFSGLAINIERPFRIDDWVKIGGFDEGKVIDITWRSTRLLTRDNCILCIPNSQASESHIRNFSMPDDTYKMIFTVQVDPAHQPGRIKKILLDAALSAGSVLSAPPPAVRYIGLNKDIHGQSAPWAANYLVITAVRNYEKKMVNMEDAMERIYIHMNRAGIRPVIQRQEIRMLPETESEPETDAGASNLKDLDLFQPLPDETMALLNQKMNIRRFAGGQTILKEGEAGDALFIIAEGVVRVTVSGEDGAPVEVAKLGAGHFFGEMAMLTGEPRYATITAVTDAAVFEIPKKDIEPFLTEKMQFRHILTETLVERKKSAETLKSNQAHPPAPKPETRYKQWVRAIRKFVGGYNEEE